MRDRFATMTNNDTAAKASPASMPRGPALMPRSGDGRQPSAATGAEEFARLYRRRLLADGADQRAEVQGQKLRNACPPTLLEIVRRACICRR